MEHYASKEDTAAVLVKLGFIRFDDVWFDSPAEDEFGMPVVQVWIYQCRENYWCVETTGRSSNMAYSSTIVWKGPKADWDKMDETVEFVEMLDKEFPGWR